MKRSILVLGGTGMLGQACMSRLAAIPGWTVEGTQRIDHGGPCYVDFSVSSNGLESVLASRQWDYVVNAIGVLRSLADAADIDSVRRAIRVNSVLPYEVADIARRFGARVIHVSTDAVFGGSADQPSTEASPVSPDDFYGKTKALGECSGDNVLNVRCSIVGRDRQHGRGLIEWLLGLKAGSTVGGFVDFTWSAATTIQLADLCAALAEPGVFDRLRIQSPVYHFAPNRPISKHDFLRTLAALARPDVGVTAEQYPGGAMHRTLATRFDDFRQLLPEPRPWEGVLAESLDIQAPTFSHPDKDSPRS